MVRFLNNSASSNLKSNSSEVNTTREQRTTDLPFCDLALDRERLQTILENIPSAIVVMEKPNGKVTYANKRAIELHGTNPCGLEIDKHSVQLRILTLDGKVYPVQELYTYRALFYGETIRNAPIVIERPDGKRFVANVSAQPLYDREGNINAAIAIFDDVTNLVKTQQALKESEERLNMAQRIAKLGSWEYYVKEDKAVWSDELFRIFGLKPQPYGPSISSYINLIHPEDRQKVQQHMPQFNKVGATTSYDYRIILSDGSIRTIHSESVILEIDEHEATQRVMGIEQDITERKKAEEDLRIKEEQLRLSLDAGDMGTWRHDMSKGMYYLDERARMHYGVTKAELSMSEILSMLHPDDVERRRREIKASTSPTSGGERFSTEYRVIHPDGSVHWLAVGVRVFFGGEGSMRHATMAFGTTQDITVRKQLHAELENYAKNLEKLVEERTKELKGKERLATIGETAGMVGHDLRNPLQTIAGEVYLAKGVLVKMPESEDKYSMQESVDTIAEQLKYMDKIVSDLQTFVKTVEVHKQAVSLKPFIDTVLGQVSIPDNIEAHVQAETDVAASADPLLLQRVLINLITNSVQAMPQGGELTVKAQVGKEGRVQIIVEDTGVGIPDEIKPKIFTPLFTTKARGQGFGLAVVKRVLEAQGGAIWFESKAGKGTKFFVDLPIA